ncbi:Cyclin-T2 [Cichlidogyrus casuarinus]|uniref:Cyclin-T2 n=1 Tax=Cichlidogyrus casuarinus TaxID=1844966 RepID=A0ABD2QC92_9PLAT
MHHLYEHFSPDTLKPILVAITSFYIACKTEDFSRKLSMLIKAAYDTLRKPMPNESSQMYKRIVHNIHALEAAILMLIGFRTLEVKQPHVILVNAIKAHQFPKEIAHTSYYICTNILHLTPLVLTHSSEAIAAAALYIAAKWNSTAMEVSHGEWFHAIDKDLTLREIKQISEDFTRCYQICDMRIREQLKHTLKAKKLERLQKIEVNRIRQDKRVNDCQGNQAPDPKRPKHDKAFPDSTTNQAGAYDSQVWKPGYNQQSTGQVRNPTHAVKNDLHNLF